LRSHAKIVVDGLAQSATIYTSTRENDMARKTTNMILEMVAEGSLNQDQLIRDLLMWMSETDVEEFAERNGLLDDEDEVDVDDSMDGDHDSAMASAGWGTDEDYGHYGPEE
jgi:hypothetical protein